MAELHIILQGKGGVGKSLVASFLSQYFLEHGKTLICLDLDPVNSSLSGYGALPVSRIDNLMQDGRIKESEFDSMMDIILKSDEDMVVVDTGASSFVPLTSYLIESEAFDLLSEHGIKTTVHTVVTGGPAMAETLAGFDALGQQLPASAGLIVWLNTWFGPIQLGDDGFELLKVYKRNEERIDGIVTIKSRSELYQANLDELLNNKMTFSGALAGTTFTVIASRRLENIRKDLWEQLEMVIVNYES